MLKPTVRAFWLGAAGLSLAGIAAAATPEGAAPRPATALSMQAAIAGALATNVDTLVAEAGKQEAAGQLTTARSEFLPHISGQVSQERRQNNLAAQGFDFGSDLGDAAGALGRNVSFPTTVTYNSFDARATLRQTLFDYSAWQDYQSAKVGRRLADTQLAVAREQVASQAELDYVALASARAEVDAARADVRQAETLFKLAQDQRQAGVATGVDVTRARARLEGDRATVAQRRAAAVRARIQLARTVGLPLGQPIRLADDLVFRPMPAGDITSALNSALASRPEIALARQQIEQREHDLASARGQRLPTLGLQASYGESASTPTENDHPTYTVGATLSVPIFSGGAIHGRIDSAASRLNQQQIRYRDTRDQVEADVRTARETLVTLAARVRAARSNLTLATDELKRSRDRFAHGVTDTVEVVDAQSSLANARSSRIDALAEYTRARINLAAALGRAQQFSLTHPMTP